MKDIITKQFYIGLIARDEDRTVAMEVLPAIEEMLNDKIDLLSLDTPLRKLYITVNFTAVTKANEPIITKADGTTLEVEVLLSRELLRQTTAFDDELRKELRDALSKVEGVPEEVINLLNR
jgi:hypothetical protein